MRYIYLFISVFLSAFLSGCSQQYQKVEILEDSVSLVRNPCMGWGVYEGKYAWIYDENYKKLIQGALDRGLKLCFRIYNNGQDNLRAGTPEYVRHAGAKGYTVKGLKGDLWTPYPDDSVFQEKLEKFI